MYAWGIPGRNKSHLKIYQCTFKWVGRHKMSTEDRASINKHHHEIKGDHLWAGVLTLLCTDLMCLFDRTYTNTITHQDAANDPEQTDHMHSIDQDAWKSALYLFIDLWHTHGEDNWGECTPPYLDSIYSLLEDEPSAANIMLNTSNPNCDTVHLHWHIIAFNYQEMELRSQGQDAWNSAIEDGTLFMYGRWYEQIIFHFDGPSN